MHYVIQYFELKALPFYIRVEQIVAFVNQFVTISMESTPPLIHMQPFVHIHFLCSTSLSSTAESSVTFTQNRLTNNTYYTLYATFYTPNVPFFQFSSQTPPNLLKGRFTFRTNEPMTYLYKCGYSRHFLRQEITRAKNITRKGLPKNAITTTTDKSECIPFLLTCNRHLSATSHPSFAVATTYSCLHLLLPSDALTTSATFLHELNDTTLHKRPYPRGSFQCGRHFSMCTHI